MAEIKQYVRSSGTVVWKLDNEYHREDGPAIAFANGDQLWYRHGKLHREDGPAIHTIAGSIEWWLDGTMYSLDEYCSKLNLTIPAALELKIKYG